MSINDLVQYASDLSKDSSIGGIIALSILSFVGISIICGAILGLKKGTGKLVLASAITAVAIIASIVLLGMKGEILVGLFDGATVKDALVALEEYNISIVMEDGVAALLDCFESAIITDIAMVPIAALILPIAFLLFFIVISIILKIVGFIISLITGFGRGKKGFLSRLLGGAIGAVRGAVIAAVVLFPIVALLTTAESAVTMLRDEPEDNEAASAVVELYDTYLQKANESPVIQTINSLGAEQLYTYLATTEINGKQADTRETLNTLVKLWTETYRLSGMDWKALNEDNKAAIENITLQISQDEFLSHAAAGVLRGLGKAVREEVIAIDIEAPYNELLVAFISSFESSTSDNVGDDLSTYTKVYFILSDNGVLEAFGEDSDAVLTALTAKDSAGKTVIAKITDELRKNDRTSAMVEMLAKLSVSIMAGQLNMDEEALEVYEGIKSDINGVLSVNNQSYDTPEEKKEAVSDALKSTLQENNVNLSDDVIDEMSDYVINNIDTTEVTDEVVFDIIFSYYDAYLSAGAN